MQIEVLGVTVSDKGKYRQADVSYTSNGKTDGKKIMSFTFKEVFKTLSEAKQGDKFDVKSEKNPKGYWDWTEVTSSGKNTGGPTEVSSKSTPVRSTYETPEERAKRQVYIVRQSSVSSAIELLKFNHVDDGGPVTEEDVINVAKKFEEFVFGIEPVVQPAEVS